MHIIHMIKPQNDNATYTCNKVVGRTGEETVNTFKVRIFRFQDRVSEMRRGGRDDTPWSRKRVHVPPLNQPI